MFELNLDISHFLDTYWQKKPTVIKQAFIDFENPIVADEITGLAMEKEVESCLVYKEQDKWQRQSGPFTTFAQLEKNGSNLLIQAADHWHDEAQQLVRSFRFLPNWRIDDLLLSYASSEGGIVPRINSYDIFIIQGSGRSHWRVGEKVETQKFAMHKRQQQCQEFSAIIDVNLEPGDMLYIPCAYPHEGYAIETAINYSLGVQTPDQNELLSSFADYALQQTEAVPRFCDSNMQIREKPGQIEEQELKELHRIMFSRCQTPEMLIPWFGRTVSTARHELDIAAVEPPHSTDEILELFADGAQFTRLSGLRAVYFQHSPGLLFINGEQFSCEDFSELSHYLCDQDDIGCEIVELLSAESDALNLFTRLVNRGYWYAV